MTAEPDVRAYYRALGVALPDRHGDEVSVRCFASPEAHTRRDRKPSCSVNTRHGAWKCNGCGACGGAYDAAIVLGHSRRSAIDLMVAHGLATRRVARTGRATPQLHEGRPRPSTSERTSEPQVHVRPRLTATDADVAEWARALRAHAPVLRYLSEHRAWSPSTVLALGVGLRGDRITIPMRDEFGTLVGVQRYKPRRADAEPKARNMWGTTNAPFPHPSVDRVPRILLVEGLPDALAARSHGLPAVGLPGVQSWQPDWALTFAGRSVSVLFDCDDEGRRAAQRVARDLFEIGLDIEVLDLDPQRHDGYDLTDWLLEQLRPAVPLAELRASASSVPILPADDPPVV